MTQAFAKHLWREGIAEERIGVVTNRIEPEKITPEDPATVRAREGIPATAFVCAFVGTLGMAHGLETALQAAAETVGDPKVLHLLMGEGAGKEKIREEGRSNVLLLDGHPRREALDVLNGANVSLVLLKDTPLFETMIPSKIFEAMALHKPIMLGRGAGRVVASSRRKRAVEWPSRRATLRPWSRRSYG